MARILAISSQVVRGHVGLSAIVPALQRLGHEVWALPTIVLSNHPGHPIAAGTRIDPELQTQMLAALERNGWLGEIDAAITGYLPSPGHVGVAAGIVRRLKAQRNIAYLCDPVLGDDAKGLYLDPSAAVALRDELIGMADIATPNRFELGWLAGDDVQTIAGVQVAALALAVRTVIVTSAAQHDGRISTLMVTPAGNHVCDTAWRPEVPHGTGDFFAALVLGHHLNGESAPMALGRAAAAVDVAIAASAGRDELELAASQDAWANAPPLTVRRLPSMTGEGL
jgi:pyridoxine kinase